GRRWSQKGGGTAILDGPWGGVSKARLRMLADVGIGPAIKTALTDTYQVVRWQMVAEAITLLHDGPKLAGLGMERERRWIARAGGERCLVGPISVEALDGRLGLRFDTDVPG